MTREIIFFTPHILHKMVVDVITWAWGHDIKECCMHVHFQKQEVMVLGPSHVTDESCCIAGLRFY